MLLFQIAVGRLATIAAVAMLMAVAGPASAETSPKPADASRIVVAGGALTEILYDLGVADRIVAVDTTSQYPPEALKTKKSLGYLRSLSTEGVLAANPTLVLASDKAGPPEVVKALRSAVAYEEIDDSPGADALVARVRKLAGLVGKSAEGEALSKRIADAFTDLAAERAKLAHAPRVLFVLSVQNGRLLVGGRNTAADVVLGLAGAANAASRLEGFKPVAEEALVEMAPEALLVMHAAGPTDAAAGVRALASVQANPRLAGRIIEMDGLLLMGFGPRAPAAARELMQRLAASAGVAGAAR